MALTTVDALAPLVADARGLFELRRSLWTAFPAADSPAMAERVDEAKLADTWHDLPVTAAQNYVVMLGLGRRGSPGVHVSASRQAGMGARPA